MEIRRLTVSEDLTAFLALRAEAVTNAPEAFGETAEEIAQKTQEELEFYLGDHGRGDFVLGAFIDDALIGVAGFYREAQQKTAHKGNVWGVYVNPDHRGKRIAETLVAALIEQARKLPGLTHLNLHVVATNAAAFSVYKKLGFTPYGTEPHATLDKGISYDNHLMQLEL